MKIYRFLPNLLFILCYGLICFFMLVSTFNFLYPMLVFNTLLATLPLIFINLSHDFEKLGKKGWQWIFMSLWLLFFPNALYMITDLIHITGNNLIQYEPAMRYESSRGVIYSTDIMSWSKLFVIGIGVMYATLVGLLSLDLFLSGLKKREKFFRVGLLIMVSGLTGIGVFIGRFLRLNSWDILNPLGLAKILFNEINQFSLEFSLIFMLYTLASYGVFYLFKNHNSF